MRTSGVVFDVYDDVGGTVLRTMFESRDALPDFVKQAHAITHEERSRLPDDAFALVLLNGEEKLRKFACIDEGNTALSVLYFIKNAHKLPTEARQVAAENLKIACGWYGLDVPEELEKEAVSHEWVEKAVRSAKASPAKLKSFANRQFDKAMKMEKGVQDLAASRSPRWDHLESVQGKRYTAMTEAAGRAAGALNRANKELSKRAGLAGMAIRSAARNPVGTAMTAMVAPSVVKGTSQNIKANLANVHAGEALGGIAGGLASQAGPHGMEHLASAFGVKQAEVVGTTTMPLSAPAETKTETSKTVVKKTAHLRSVVDVTDKEAMPTVIVKKASRYALGEKYPLDTYEQVKMASSYFDEYCKRFDPADRHTFCVALVKRANELDIPLSDTVRKYGSEKYASAIELQTAIDSRIALLLDRDQTDVLQELSKMAGSIPPEDYVTVLSEFDKTAGLNLHYDGDVMDPFYSTYGFEKTAEDEKKDFTDVIGNYYVTGADLCRLKSNRQGLESTFGCDFCEEFCKDPVGIYKSLPVEQKKLLIRMATENSPV